MKLSVVITAYNVGRFLAETIDSALQQTRPPDQIIIVDDASTDGTAELLRGFGAAIEVVHHDVNRGVLASTITAMRAATGDVVCFLDGDDVWERRKLELVEPRFAAQDVIVVSHDYRFIDGRGQTLREEDGTQQRLRALAASADPTALSEAMRSSILEYRGHVWLGSAWSIRRRVLDLDAFATWAACLPDARRVYQDHPLATYLVASGNGRLDYVPEKLLRYRVHADNYSSAPRDLERARLIVEKGWHTRRATLDLVEKLAPDRRSAAVRQREKLREYEFLAALYAGHRIDAAKYFVACAGSIWTPLQALKELARLGTVAAVGPRRFLALRARANAAARRLSAGHE